MKKTRKLLGAASLAGAVLLGLTPATHACTGGALIAQDGGVAVGRTLEFGKPMDSVIAVWPVGSQFTGKTPKGDAGLKWEAKYGFLGPTAASHNDMLLDGINDKGLNVGLFYFPGYAQYPPATPENSQKGMSPPQVTAWILGTCATVDEVREKIGGIALLPVVLEDLGIVPSLHIKVQDPTGECIVIEPRGGQLLVHDNPVRVLTNAPEFPWHLTNLNTYLDMSTSYPPSRKVGDLQLSPFGMGAGSLGLPGDFSPPSRFVRMAFFLQNAMPQSSSAEAVATMFHFLNNFDIPPGVAMPPAGTSEKYPDFTTWTTVADLSKKQYHWKTFGDHRVRVIDLSQALASSGGKMTTVEMGPQSNDSFSPSEPVKVE